MVFIIFHNGTVMGHDIIKVPGQPIGQLKKLFMSYVDSLDALTVITWKQSN